MQSLVDSHRTNAAGLPVVFWTSKVTHPSYQEALEIIRNWWVGIAGKQVNWEVVIGIGGSSSLKYQCCLDKTLLRDSILYYRTQPNERCHFVPVKELYLDLELQMLTIITESLLDLTYRVSLL